MSGFSSSSKRLEKTRHANKQNAFKKNLQQNAVPMPQTQMQLMTLCRAYRRQTMPRTTPIRCHRPCKTIRLAMGKDQEAFLISQQDQQRSQRLLLHQQELQRLQVVLVAEVECLVQAKVLWQQKHWVVGANLAQKVSQRLEKPCSLVKPKNSPITST